MAVRVVELNPATIALRYLPRVSIKLSVCPVCKSSNVSSFSDTGIITVPSDGIFTTSTSATIQAAAG